jgi:hypothetical protein
MLLMGDFNPPCIQNLKSKIARHQSGISSGSEPDRSCDSCDSCSLGNGTAGNSSSTGGNVVSPSTLIVLLAEKLEFPA